MSGGQAYKYKNLELSQLRSFCLAATQGSFTAAAQALGVSTSAVWQQVRGLEGTLKASLIRRRGRVVELTPDGSLLLGLVQPHVSGLDSLYRLFEARRAGVPQRLIAAATPSLLADFMPPLVQEFARSHPAVQLHLRAGRWREVLDMVERGDADIGLAPHDPQAERRGALDYEHLFDLPFVLVTTSRHRLTRKKRIEAGDLLPYPLIVEPEDTCNYQSLRRFLQYDAIDPNQMHIAMVSHSLDITFKYVSLGLGIAVGHFNPNIEVRVPGLHLRLLDSHHEGLPVFLLRRKSCHLPDAAEAFRGLARDSLGPAQPARR
jgi:DNA-binding transcriptional LysR family regulator